MGVWKEAWASERRFQDALALLAAAERVCLSTSMLADQARAVWLRGSGESTEAYIRTTDSALVATEKLVRGEIARVR